MIIMLLAGCGTSVNKYNVYERLYAAYSTIQSFKAEVSVTSYSNNSENKYTLLQYYKYPDKQRSEYVSDNGGGSITVINGNQGKIFNGNNDPVILDALEVSDQNYMLLSTFFERYYASEETVVSVSGSEDNGTITLEAETGLSHPYRKSMKLVVNTKDLKPISMTVYGYDEKPSLLVEYNSFELNAQIDDSIFE